VARRISRGSTDRSGHSQGLEEALTLDRDVLVETAIARGALQVVVTSVVMDLHYLKQI
jgi:hypothetical protein